MNDMNDLSVIVDKIESVLLNIMYLKPEERIINPNMSILNDLKNLLNELFNFDTCDEVIYTLNTDKPFFGIRINLKMDSSTALLLLATDKEVNLNMKYQVEFDSKLFDIDLSAEELAAYLIHEISSIMFSNEAVDNTRALIDLELLANDDVVNLRNSINYSQLIIYALKDTLYKVSSLLFKNNPEDLIANKWIQAISLEDVILSTQQKIFNSVSGLSDSVKEPKTIILHWMLMIYKDIQHNSCIIKDALKDAKDFTGSKLDKIEIDKTLKAVDKIESGTLVENCSIVKAFNNKKLYPLAEISLFKSLKVNGLRSIEDSLYEFSLRLKNCDTEEDAMYILRAINTRLNILEDYIYNTPDLSDNERKHWELVAQKYRILREQLVKKKIANKKQYGLFFDYDQLDYLDKTNSDD